MRIVPLPRGRVLVLVHSTNATHAESSLAGRDVIKDEIGGKLPSGRPFRPDVRARPCLPCGRGFTRGRVFTVRGRGSASTRTPRPRVRMDMHRANAGPCPRERGCKGAETFRVSTIKGGALPLFPHFQPIPVE
jgi:hypothetical protein